MRARSGAGYRRILREAWPILLSQWASMGYAVLDTLMTGHASADDLAAMGLGAAVYTSVFVGLMGVLQALNPLVAADQGAGRHRAAGEWLAQSAWLALGLAALGVVLLRSPDLWRFFSGPLPVHVQALVSQHLAWLSWALPWALLFRAYCAFNIAISRPKAVMMLNLGGLGVKAVLNAVLIYGWGPFPPMGAPGCGLSTFIVCVGLALSALFYLRGSTHYVRYALHWQLPRLNELLRLLRLGVPIGLSYFIEVTSFTFMAFLAARLGVLAVGAHQILANLGALLYMMPLALSLATSTRVAQALGRGRNDQARRTAWHGFHLALVLGTSSALVLWLARAPIVAAYSNNALVQQQAAALFGVLALFHMADALQCMASFVLRAYRIVVLPMLVYGTALWGLGLGGGYVLAFEGVAGLGLPALQLPGLWISAAGSLMLAALVLCLSYWRLTRHAAPH